MGRVAAAFGVRGFVRVEPWSEDPQALLAHATWWLKPRDSDDWRAVRVAEARPHGGAIVASLAGIADRDAASALRGARVGVAREALPALRDDELYWADLEGLAVINRDGVDLGRVAGVLDNGAHAVLRVRAGAAPERLIPWVPLYVDAVDLDARRIDVDWPADF